jgi:hypothetical protein
MRDRPDLLRGAAALCGCVALSCAATGFAQDARRGEHREAGAHVHSVADLAVAIEGSEVTVELQSPFYNLVGFERPPANDTEISAWMDAARAVREPARIILLPAEAGCRLSRSSLGVLGATPVSVGAGQSKTEPGQHHVADHGHDHGDDKNGDSAFHDALLSWTFRCANIQGVTSFEAAALRSFPRLTSLDTVFLGASAQKAGVLTREAPRFQVR